jgi:hypothetical protein
MDEEMLFECDIKELDYGIYDRISQFVKGRVSKDLVSHGLGLALTVPIGAVLIAGTLSDRTWITVLSVIVYLFLIGLFTCLLVKKLKILRQLKYPGDWRCFVSTVQEKDAVRDPDNKEKVRDYLLKFKGLGIATVDRDTYERSTWGDPCYVIKLGTFTTAVETPDRALSSDDMPDEEEDTETKTPVSRVSWKAESQCDSCDHSDNCPFRQDGKDTVIVNCKNYKNS